MKAALVMVLVSALALVQCKPAEEGKYTSKYDNINVDEVLASDRLLSNYFDCLMDRKPCTAEGSELKGDEMSTLCKLKLSMRFHWFRKGNII
ncbi:hypothetical protein J437_LFUL013195 [Ladona fulva]|uniref:Uncharacterized protein n=1 Tax=Ladona fulva TaxID=123851 RepID=A0A8K0KGG4_LADFU|nr:hypothetical protein J437_LFUL013195 [Ladona fulva]